MPHRETRALSTPAPNAISSRVRRMAKRRAALEPPFTFARRSSAHEEHPERNEDYVLADSVRGLAGVFDGVGGVIGGEIASRVAAQYIWQRWKSLIKKQQSPRRSSGIHFIDETKIDLPSALQSLILDAHTQVGNEGLRRAKSQYGDIAEFATPKTTIALAACCQAPPARSKSKKRYKVIYAWVGDSRIYLLRPSKPLTRLTSDDGLLTEFVTSGQLGEKDALRIDQATQPWQLTRVERFFFEKRNGITQALGDREPPNIHIAEATISVGDRLLLCTDGIHDNLTDKELEALLRKGARTTVARHIVEAAIERSRQDLDEAMRAKPDDMSAVVVTCHR